MTSQSPNRSYDIVIYGAEGFVGNLLCDYINKSYSNIRWGIAGKDRKALEDTKKKLKLKEAVAIFPAKVDDKHALKTIASNTKVLISVVAPYREAGLPIIDACVEAGTDYCDISGETPFIRDVIDKYDNQAKEKQIRIVNCCGFDSIPADLGVQFVVEELKKKSVVPKQATMIIEEAKGSVSMGTIKSMIGVFETSSVWQLLSLFNPYYLNPGDGKSLFSIPYNDRKLLMTASDRTMFGYDFNINSWTFPYIMQIVDSRVVNRSNALSDFQYGRRFIFSEKSKATSYLMAIICSVAYAVLNFFLLTPITRRVLKFIIPRFIRGPSQELLDNGYFKIKMIGNGIENQSGKEVTVVADIQAFHGDPGYRQTAKMLTESALCLIKDKEQLPKNYGVVTPSIAFGPTLRKRLNEKGISFQIAESK